MARKVTFLTSLLALSTWILLSPIGVRGLSWNSADVCNTTLEPYCYLNDSTHSWTVNLDCSRPDEVTVLYSDYSGPLALQSEMKIPNEIRLECTDGNVEAVMREVNCSIRRFGGGTPNEGPYSFINLSGSGIQPGWTCTITGCFIIDDGSSDDLLVHTPAKKFILPQCTSGECTCIEPDTVGSTTVEMLDTTIPTTSDITTTGVGQTTEALPTTTIMPSATATRLSSVRAAEGTSVDGILLPTVVKTDPDNKATTPNYQGKTQVVIAILIVVLILLIAMILPTIMYVNCWMKHRKDRKILLVIDKQNMVFDPTYTPAICIDKPDLSLSHRISVVSTGYLQYLEPLEKLNFCEGYQVSSDPYCVDLSPELASPLSKPPFGGSVNCSNQEDIAMDTDDCSKEFPGNSGYILESRVANNDDAIESSSDIKSELIQDCSPLKYIHGNLRNPNDRCRRDGVELREALQSSEQESVSEDAMSILLSENGPSKNVGFSLDQHYSSSGSDYVQQSRAPNSPFLLKEYPDSTPTNNNIFELDLELHEKQLDGYQPQPSNLGTGHHETTTYVESEQFNSQNTQNYQYGSHKEVKCDDFDFSDSYSLDSSVLTQSLHSTTATLPGAQEAYNLQTADHAHLSNMDGYVQNEQQPSLNTTLMHANGQDTESVELNFDTEGEIELQDPPRSALDKNLDLCSQVDLPRTPPTTSLSRGYEDNTPTATTTTEPFTREIELPVSEISPFKTEPNVMVHLDFDENKSCQHPIVLESGLEIGQSGDQKQWHCHSGTSGYIPNEGCLTQTVGKGQYISYDFVPLTDELRKESSSDCLSVKCDPADISESQNVTSVDIDIESQSNYTYYPSDVSSGYLSGSSVTGDTRTYVSQLREIS